MAGNIAFLFHESLCCASCAAPFETLNPEFFNQKFLDFPAIFFFNSYSFEIFSCCAAKDLELAESTIELQDQKSTTFPLTFFYHVAESRAACPSL